MAQSIRINITVDRETLRLADREARRQKTSRSEFIRKAVRDQAENRRQLAEDKKQLAVRLEAAARMDRIAHQFGDWPAEQILRESRNRWRSKRS